MIKAVKVRFSLAEKEVAIIESGFVPELQVNV